MKKFLLLLLCMFLFDANATEMCARDDTVVVPLDAVAGPSGNGKSDGVESMWYIPFGYGNIYGSVTCLSTTEVMGFVPSWDGNSAAPSILPTDDDELMGRTGTDENGNTRHICYMKMTHPLATPWIQTPFGSGCNNCMYSATVGLKTDVNVRTKFFNSVLQ